MIELETQAQQSYNIEKRMSLEVVGLKDEMNSDKAIIRD